MERNEFNGTWFVLHVETGKEEQIVTIFREKIGTESGLFDECFYITYEDVWRYHQYSIVEKRIFFPGYIFIISKRPMELYQELKKIPQFTQLMLEKSADSPYFYDLPEDEAEFLRALLTGNEAGDYCVKRSYILWDGRRIVAAEGALAPFLENIVKAEYKKRRVIIEKKIFGSVKRLKLCIYDRKDCEAEHLPIPALQTDRKPFEWKAGEYVELWSEAYEGKALKIARVDEHRRKVYVEVELFGTTTELEVEEEEIKTKRSEE